MSDDVDDAAEWIRDTLYISAGFQIRGRPGADWPAGGEWHRQAIALFGTRVNIMLLAGQPTRAALLFCRALCLHRCSLN